MKTQMNKYIIILGGIIAPAIALAQIGFSSAIPDGSYRGHYRGIDSGKVQLLTQAIRGCEGCFIAVLFKNQRREKRIEAYKAVPTKSQSAVVRTTRKQVEEINTSSEYNLIPMGVESDGELTTPNDNPSLVLSVEKYAGTRAVEFTILTSNTNRTGTQSAMLFTGAASNFDMDNGEAGRYKTPMKIRSQGSINMITENKLDGSRVATATLLGDASTKTPSGSFIIKEKAPGVFTFSSVAHFASGQEVSTMPSKLVIFMKKMGRERAYLINPSNASDIAELKVMN